ncbi:MAG: hypothetical protein ACLT4X_03910 [Phascolarctobacterium sp.]
MTGSYEFPVHTMTGDVRRDIILIDKVIGVGELALSDHRSSEPTLDELKRVLTQARLGGMLSGKAGVVQFHMGIGAAGIEPLRKFYRIAKFLQSILFPLMLIVRLIYLNRLRNWLPKGVIWI